MRRRIDIMKIMSKRNPPVFMAFPVNSHSEGKSVNRITNRHIRRMMKTSKSLSVTMVANEELLLILSMRPM